MNVQSQLIAHYLRQLRDEASLRLPQERADELVADLEADLNERIGPEATEAEIRSALERLGSPSELVDEAGGADLVAEAPRSIRLEVIALACLLSSATLLLVIPQVAALVLVVGLVLLLRSPLWGTLDKVVACITYVAAGAPGVLVVGLLSYRSSVSACESPAGGSGSSPLGPLNCAQSSTPWLPWVLVTALVILHLVTLIRLVRGLRGAR